MTRSEYQELVEFLSVKFDGIEGRLAKAEVGNEQNAHQIQVLAEGITSVDQKLDRFREEVAGEFRAVRGEMAEGFRTQGDRMDGLARRMDQWEARSL